MNKKTVLENHLEFKKTSVKFEPKLKDIERYLDKFINSNKKSLDKFNEDDVNKFLNSLTYSTRTINDIKTYLKVFIKWHYPDWSSRFRNLERICKMQKPSKTYQPEDMLSFQEIKKLIEGEKDLMYKVYWTVFFYGGFRPSEACNLKWSNVFFEPQGTIIKVHATKTKKDFYKSLPREAEHLLQEWKKYNDSEWIFPSSLKDNEPIVARSICGRLKRLSKRILNREVVPYQLRHSIATILYKDDSRKDDVSAQQLGHNKSMKDTYLNLDEDGLKAKARKLWIKPKKLSPEERDEFEKMKKSVERQKNTLSTIMNILVKNKLAIKNDKGEIDIRDEPKK